MRKQILNTLYLAIFGLFILQACSDDDEPTVFGAPVITATSTANGIFVGQSATISVSVSSEVNIASIVAQASGGTLTQQAVDLTAGTATFSFTADAAGNYTITVTATDDQNPAKSSEATVQVEVAVEVFDAPTITAQATLDVIKTGESTTVNVVASSGANLAAISAETTGGTITEQSTDLAAGTAAYSFTATEAGDYTLTFTATDDQSPAKSSQTTVQITVEQPLEIASMFSEISQLSIAGEASAEITAYDAVTSQLFVVNNGATNPTQVDVINFSNPAAPAKAAVLDMSSYGGGVNSVAVYGGKLAVAMEANDKQANGSVVVFNTSDLSEITTVTVGALPDMVTFSPDGNLIITANEGEPSDDYTVDPEGSVSIIEVNNGYAVTTANFNAFDADVENLKAAGVRVFGPGASLSQDLEPEYVAVSDDSQMAYVTLQENNALAVVDLTTKTITNILPLGYKDHSLAENALDASDRDNLNGNVASYANLFGMYQPDAIAFLEGGYLITANEGDARDYAGFAEEERIKDLTLDPTAFPDAANLQADEQLGRLNITTTLGDTDGDGDYDALYAYGARSFTIWNTDGTQAFDSRNELEERVLATIPGNYDDGRADNKGAEPEGIAIGKVGDVTLAFIGLERYDAVVVYDISVPTSPAFLQVLAVGDAPEGLLFISAEESPDGNSYLIVSSEDDGFIKIFQPARQ